MTEPSLPQESIFLQVLEIPVAERAAFLDRVCGGNSAVRAEVDELLHAHQQSGDLLDLPESLSPTVDQPNMERPGAVIGHYKLLQQLGEGGMGTVFMAEQTEPVRRMVALKIIKPGMDSRQIIARFEAERQALALMDHPNIAKVLDAGTTDTSRPYFVMELVKGVPITRYCDEHHLTPRQRLELFIPVCQAVQHAHQKGIIHRDLKPSNVLVAEYDDKPVAKVIDFGVAKATGPKLTDRTMFTEFGQVLGTLDYMSPEQAKLNQLDIDTRSDIYSLGVLLYELLTGTTPFEKKRLLQAAFDEILRIIREEEPPKPSARLSTTAESVAIAANRGLEPKKLSGVVRGELDWIVMKCLEKNRNRRYEAANGLAHDIERYLNDEAVYACPPSVAYRLRKFVRRNRTAVAVAVSAVGLLLLAVFGLTVSNIRIAQEKALAKARGDEAEANFRKARQAVDDQFTLVSQSQLFETPGFQSLRKDLLESALKYYLEFLQQRPDDPDLQAEVAAAYLRLYQVREAVDSGLSANAVQALAKGIEIVEKLRREHPNDAGVCNRVAGFAKGNRDLHGVYSGRGPRAYLVDALPLLERAAKIWEALVQENPGVIEFQNDLATFYQATIDVQDAFGGSVKTLALPNKIHAIRESLARAKPDILEYRMDLALSHTNLGWTMARGMCGDFSFAEVDNHFRRGFELAKQLAEEHQGVTEYRSELALRYREQGLWLAHNEHFADAEQAYRQMLIVQEKLSAEYPTVPRYEGELESGNWVLGNLLRDTGRPEKAEEAYRKSLAICEKQVAAFPTNADCLGALALRCFSLGPLLAASDRSQEADQLYRKALAFTPDGPDGHNCLAMLLLICPDPNFRDPVRAVELAKKATDLGPKFGNIWNTLGMAYYRVDDWEHAILALEKAIEFRNGGDGWDWIFLAMAHRKLGDKAKAREWYDKASQWMEKNHAPKDELWRELRSYRAEAADLLGIEDRPKRK